MLTPGQSNPRLATYCPFCQTTRLERERERAQERVALPAAAPPPYVADPTPASEAPPPQPRPTTPPPAYSASLSATRAPAQALSSGASPQDAPQEGDARDVTHFLSPSDTLLGLSLAYGVPLSVLRAHNRLHADHLLSARRTLAIPASHYRGASLSPRPVEGEEESKRKANLRRFMVRCKCADYKVATLYLEEHGWDLERAVDKWADDERWEREHPMAEGKGKGTVKART